MLTDKTQIAWSIMAYIPTVMDKTHQAWYNMVYYGLHIPTVLHRGRCTDALVRFEGQQLLAQIPGRLLVTPVRELVCSLT